MGKNASVKIRNARKGFIAHLESVPTLPNLQSEANTETHVTECSHPLDRSCWQGKIASAVFG